MRRDRTIMHTLIAALFEALFGSLLRRWEAGARTFEIIKKILGVLFFTWLIGFCFFNLYWLTVSGLVFRAARRNRGWIDFTDDPIAFIAWSALYSVPLFLAALAIFAFISQRREHRRATFRHFTDGIGPPPLVQVMDPPAPDGANVVSGPAIRLKDVGPERGPDQAQS